MTPRTYNDVAPQLAKVCGHAGLRVNDPRVLDAVNFAQERLLNMGDWVGTFARLRMCVSSSTVALPFEYEAAVYAAFDRSNIPVLNRSFEFLAFGPGHQDTANADIIALFDRGEMPVVAQPCSKYVVVTGTEDERVNGERPVVRIYGEDASGYPLRTANEDGTFTNGIEIEINGDASPFTAESDILVRKITSIDKPLTKGAIDISYRDPTDDSISFGGRYWHWVTRPTFRIYHVPGVDATNGTTLHVIARRRFIPVTESTMDVPLLITNFPALRKGVMAYAKEEAGQLAEAEALFASAAMDLTNEKRTYERSLRPAVEPSHMGSAFAIPHVL